jgi:hypothetical protein
MAFCTLRLSRETRRGSAPTAAPSWLLTVRLGREVQAYFSGHRALDFLIRNDNLVEGKTVYLKGTIIMTGATLYELVLVYEAQNYSDSDYSRFRSSLVLR